MPAPFTTPVAWSVPFESEPDRPNGFVSENTQEAIEEALDRAISNDRFLLLAEYGGQANNGRYLNFFASINSLEAPLFLDNPTKVITIVCETTATSSNAKIGFFDLEVSTIVPLYELSMDGLKTKTDIGSAIMPLFELAEHARLAIRVTSGSISKPHLYIIFSSGVALT